MYATEAIMGRAAVGVSLWGLPPGSETWKCVDITRYLFPA